MAALAEKHAKPTKKYSHKDTSVDGEFRNVFAALEKLHLGPFRMYYDETYDALFIQVRDKTNAQQYVSIIRIEAQTGDVYIRGALNALVGDNVGNAGRM